MGITRGENEMCLMPLRGTVGRKATIMGKNDQKKEQKMRAIQSTKWAFLRLTSITGLAKKEKKNVGPVRSRRKSSKILLLSP